MGLSQFVKFFVVAKEFVPADSTASKRQAPIHQRIVATSIVSTIVAGGLGTLGVILGADDTVVDREGPVIFVLGPLVSGAVGTIFGAALGCLLAPTRSSQVSPAPNG
jgi:hypothetical protein